MTGAVELCLHADARAAVEALARQLAAQLAGAIARTGSARIALAGGATPRALYERLAEPDLAPAVPWERVDVLFGDERCVAPHHPDSNQRMAHEALLDRVGVDPARVHAVDGLAAPDEAARRYAEHLALPLDVVLLGIGEDGHTASLFPGGPGLAASDPPVVATRAPRPPHERVSLSLATLVRARSAYLVALGPAKHAIVRRVVAEFAAPVGPRTLPAARVRPADGSAWLHVDRAAWEGEE